MSNLNMLSNEEKKSFHRLLYSLHAQGNDCGTHVDVFISNEDFPRLLAWCSLNEYEWWIRSALADECQCRLKKIK